MTPEVLVLALAALLQAGQTVLMAVPANLELGSARTLGPRDQELIRDLSTRTARLYRAVNNHTEALVLFTAAVAVTVWAGASTPLSQACAWIYLAARVLYVPAYAFGWVPWRSLFWLAGFAATILMILAALLNAP